MTVAVQLDFKGAKLEQYDAVRERLGLLPGGPGPSDALFHWVAKTDEGIRTVTVWDSRAKFETFAHDTLLPNYREVGVVDPPDIQCFDVHSYLAAGQQTH
jgi:hypothetical protein